MTLDPAVAVVRLAVRRDLGLLSDGRGGSWAPNPRTGCVLVACSGGADSLALLTAIVFEAPKVSIRVIGVVVDHGLQDGSAEHTARVVAQMAELGVDETASIRVTVDPGPAGIEAGAREARYAALGQLAEHFEADVVLLGHTRDDQAETVLLGLTRGSGGRSLAGMRPTFHLDQNTNGARFTRPMLDLTRAQTEAACRAQGVGFWTDPHNEDPRFTRSRIRHTVMPMLEAELGPGVAAALARTGEQLRHDMDFIQVNELDAYHRARSQDGSIDMDEIDDVGLAIRTRAVRRAAIESGAIPSELTHEHVRAMLRLLGRTGKETQLPGHVTAYAEGEVLRFRPTVPR